MRSLVLLAMLALAQAADAHGQNLPFNLGRKVRVVLDCPADSASAAQSASSCRRYAGALVEASGGFLVLQNDSGQITRLPASSVTSLRVQLGTRNQSGKMALFLGAIGLVAGGNKAHSSWEPCVESGWFDFHCMYALSHGAATVLGALGGAGVGAGIGAIIGTAIRTERWETVRLEHLRASVAASPQGGVGLQLSVAF